MILVKNILILNLPKSLLQFKLVLINSCMLLNALSPPHEELSFNFLGIKIHSSALIITVVAFDRGT